jgi:chromosome segregation ATPase
LALEKVNDTTEKAEKCKNKSLKYQALVEEFDVELQDIRARENKAQIAIEPLKQAARDLKKKVTEVKDKIDAAEQDKTQVSLQVGDTQSQLHKLEKQIAIERKKQSLDHKSLEEEVDRRVGILTSQIEKFRNDFEKVNAD